MRLCLEHNFSCNQNLRQGQLLLLIFYNGDAALDFMFLVIFFLWLVSTSKSQFLKFFVLLVKEILFSFVNYLLFVKNSFVSFVNYLLFFKKGLVSFVNSVFFLFLFFF